MADDKMNDKKKATPATSASELVTEWHNSGHHISFKTWMEQRKQHCCEKELNDNKTTTTKERQDHAATLQWLWATTKNP